MLGRPPAALERTRLRQLYDVASSRVLYALCALGIPDKVPAGGVPAGQIASALQLNHDALVRLLRSAETLGVVALTAGQHVGLTAAGELLRAGAEGSLQAEFSDNDLFVAWDDFAETIRSGIPSYQARFGRPVFDRLLDDPAALRLFNEHMRERAIDLYSPFVPWIVHRAGNDFVDVGGGFGGLTEMLLTASPTARSVIVDLPEVVGRADPSLSGRFPGRVELAAGDMFRWLPKGHTTYIYASVLHDWDDPDAIRLLTQCRAAMPPAGRVLVLDRMLGEGDVAGSAMGDMWMLAMTGGRERDRAHWYELARCAGFSVGCVLVETGMSLLELLVRS